MRGGTATGDADDPVQLTAVRFAAEPDGAPKVQFDPGDSLTISLDIELSDAQGPIPEKIYVHASVLGPQDVPVWNMETRGGVWTHAQAQQEPDEEGNVGDPSVRRVTVDFVVPEVPALLGAFAFRAQVSDAYTGTPLNTRRFPDLFGIAGPQAGGLLPVAYEIRDRG
jgi:ABC-2 type transport system ATP-binding protein